MTTLSENSSIKTITEHIFWRYSAPNRTFKIAFTLSIILHALLLMPTQLFKSHRKVLPNENLVEVKLVTKTNQPKQAAKPTNKPRLKRKRKLKTKKKSAPLKKSQPVTKESTLARHRTIPKKKTPANSKQLEKIKNRLARQQEDEKLNQIRQRLRDNASPAAKARQSTLTQAYNQTLTAWIMRNWHLPEYLLNSGLEATISLTISASGALLNQTEEQLSGNAIFDHAMRQAISNANPFPHFPTELTIPQEEFVITFNPNNINKEN